MEYYALFIKKTSLAEFTLPIGLGCIARKAGDDIIFLLALTLREPLRYLVRHSSVYATSIVFREGIWQEKKTRFFVRNSLTGVLP